MPEVGDEEAEQLLRSGMVDSPCCQTAFTTPLRDGFGGALPRVGEA